MAKSLKCTDCGLLLHSVAEAQAHNDATGHTGFEETLEVIKILSCDVCGKPCRTDAQRELHTKYTGHAAFSDKTDASNVINTEEEMKMAEKALKEESGLAPSALEVATSASQEQEMVTPEVDESLLISLEDMGFSRNRSVRALFNTKASSVEQAISWLADHEEDADIDEPLFVPKSSLGPKLTPEEARLKAEELVRKAKERREREEKEQERHRELERIRAGKEMQKLRQKEEDQSLKRVVEHRAREKAEEARAREDLRRRLEEDRRDRRRRLGLPEELTEEEKEREAEKRRRETEEQQAKKVFNFVKPVTALSKMRESLVAMKKGAGVNGRAPDPGSAEMARFQTACTTLLRYLGNVMTQPDEEKFRVIPVAGKAFSQRVACVPGSADFLIACGFQLEGEGEQATLRLPRERVDPELLTHAGGALQDAMSNPFFGML